MNIEKNAQEGSSTGSKKYIGLTEVSVVAINPGRDELIKILGVSEENEEKFKEPEYLSEDGENNTRLSLHFYLKDKGGRIFTLRFSLIDKPQVSKSGNKQWINQVGNTSYSDSKENLPGWFTQFTTKEGEVIGDKEVRQAYVGEQDVYNFLTHWLNVDLRKPSNNLFMDWKKLMRGKVDELSSFVNTDMVKNVIVLATVRVKESEEGVKEYQSVYSRGFIPTYKSKILARAIDTGDWSDKLLFKFKEEVEGEYGVKDNYYLGWLKEYNPEEFLNTTNDVINDPTQNGY